MDAGRRRHDVETRHGIVGRLALEVRAHQGQQDLRVRAGRRGDDVAWVRGPALALERHVEGGTREAVEREPARELIE